MEKAFLWVNKRHTGGKKTNTCHKYNTVLVPYKIPLKLSKNDKVIIFFIVKEYEQENYGLGKKRPNDTSISQEKKKKS